MCCCSQPAGKRELEQLTSWPFYTTLKAFPSRAETPVFWPCFVAELSHKKPQNAYLAVKCNFRLIKVSLSDVRCLLGSVKHRYELFKLNETSN